MSHSGIDSVSGDNGANQTHFQYAWLADFAWVPSALLALSFIFDYAVDIPSIDQWDGELPFLRKVASGEAGISDLIALQLEHRIGFTRAIGLFVAWFSGWNSRVFSCVTWTLMCALATFLCIINRRTSGDAIARRATTNLVGGSVLFGLAQYDLWINAMMSSWAGIEIMLVLGVMACIGPWSFPKKYAACLLLAFTATFSSSMGLQLWLLLPPLLVLQATRDRRWLRPAWLIGWPCAAVIATACYFWGYQQPAESPSLSVSPRQFISFFLAALGSPFAHGTAIDPVVLGTIAGVLAFAVFLTCCVTAWSYRDEETFVDVVLPWLCIGTFGVVSCLAIALGRAGFSVDVALSSRYITAPAISVYALFAAFPTVLDRLTAKPRGEFGATSCDTPPSDSNTLARRFTTSWLPRFSPNACLVVKTALVTLVSFSHLAFSIRSVASFENERIRLNSAKAALLFSRSFVDLELLSNIWSKKMYPGFTDELDFMDDQGYLRPKTFVSRRIGDLVRGPRQAAGGTPDGAIEQAAAVGNGGFAFAGWAISPRYRRPADVVLLTAGEGDDAEVFGVAQVGAARPEVAKALGDSDFQRCGWARVFPRDALPSSNTKIRAWSMDCSTGTVYELNGAVEWKP